jgi:hypothetical protein
MEPSAIDAVNHRGYRLTKWGVEFSRPVTPAEFEELGQVLMRIANATPWAVGDWLLAGEPLWDEGERYRLASAITGQPRRRLVEYVRVSASYEHRWRGFAPWSFYRMALALPEARRLEALAVAKERGLDLDAFRTVLRRMGAVLRRTQARAESTIVAQDVIQCPKCGCRFGAGVGIASAQRGIGE